MAVRPPRAGTAAPRAGAAGLRGLGWRGAVAGFACLVTIGSLIWALGLRTQLDNRQADLVALRALSTAAALRDNATAWTLTATAEGPAGAIGNVFYSEREQRLALAATGLPALPAGQSYRLWFVDGGQPPGSARLAGTFQTSADGSAALVMPNVPPGSVVGVAVTAAPDAETSPEPTTPYLLVGSVSAAG
ncbi:MAG: anti-sigma factor [Chloroflexia bacterium]|nr:anti-sigma factor [Chloroflexia bacterium]